MKPEQIVIARLKREVTKLKAERDILKKSRGLLREGIDVKFGFIARHRGIWPAADHGVVCSMSRSGNVWDNAAMESFFSSLKTERTARKTYRTRNEAKADVFDYIERFYNVKRRHSTIGYMSPMEFEMQAELA